MSADLAPYTGSREMLHQALLDHGATEKNHKYFCPFHDDKSTPNGSIYEKEGKWYFKCFSCGVSGDYFDVLAHAQNRPVEEIIKETLRDKAPPPRPKAQAQTKKLPPYKTIDDVAAWAERKLNGTCTARYMYNDPDTKALDVCGLRIDLNGEGRNKEFRQCYPVDGGFSIGLPDDKPRPLYNRARIRESGTILLVEGEGVVHALHEIGIVATTVLGGANSDMAKTDWAPLAGKTVILWPDDDLPDKNGKIAGQTYAKNALAQLQQLDPDPFIKIIDPKPLNLGPKGDAKDYIKRERDAGKSNSDIFSQILRLYADAQHTGPAEGVLQRIEAIIDGTFIALPWLYPQLSRQTKALQPATVTVVGGTPGSSKSWFVLENAMDLFGRGESVAILMLEESLTYWLRRALVIRAKNSRHLDDEWMQRNPDEARAVGRMHAPWMDRFGRCIHVPSAPFTLMPYVVKWVAEQAAKRTRVIIVDPITLAIVDGELFKEELRFLSMMKQDIEASGSSLILVTHPKQGALPISLNAMAGSAAYGRAVQTVLWMEHLDEDTEFEVLRLNHNNMGAAIPENVTLSCNRRMHLLKCRNSSGHGLKIAYHFEGKSVSFTEQGLIVKSMHKNKAGK